MFGLKRANSYRQHILKEIHDKHAQKKSQDARIVADSTELASIIGLSDSDIRQMHELQVHVNIPETPCYLAADHLGEWQYVLRLGCGPMHGWDYKSYPEWREEAKRILREGWSDPPKIGTIGSEN